MSVLCKTAGQYVVRTSVLNCLTVYTKPSQHDVSVEVELKYSKYCLIRDEFYFPIASISVVAPLHRMSLQRIEEEIKDKIVATAEEITELLAPSFSI